MDIRNRAPTPFPGRRFMRRLLLLYSAFIVYGSFIPFHFNFDPVFLKWRLGRFLTKSLGRGLRHFSTLDVICNVLLFAVFGFLWSAVFERARARSVIGAVLRVGAIGLLFGFAIELAQTTSPYRDASMLDALCNGLGAVLGVVAGQFVLRDYSLSPAGMSLRFLRERPWIFLLIFLVLPPLADALFPYQISLNIGTAWAKVRTSSLIPFGGGLHEPWLELLVERLLCFGAIGYVLRRTLKTLSPIGAIGVTWLIGGVLAVLVETVKLFVIGRTFEIDNLVLCSTGTLLGALVIPGLASLKIARRSAKEILVLLAIGLIGYSELMPFDWIYTNELPTKMAFIEWLPFKAYFFSNPLFAAFDMGKKLYVSIPLGFVLAAQVSSPKVRLYRATLLGSMIGVVLETSQIALRSRTPSVTDVLLIGFGSWLGAVAFEYFISSDQSNVDVFQ
ncbi:MAG: VanZ family protein [Alphaproteobacteria bacterium]